jgi:hypothetical protein
MGFIGEILGKAKEVFFFFFNLISLVFTMGFQCV